MLKTSNAQLVSKSNWLTTYNVSGAFSGIVNSITPFSMYPSSIKYSGSINGSNSGYSVTPSV